jgi:hypothetical protein
MPSQAVRDDDEDRRMGTGHLCLDFQPLHGWRPVKGTVRRTATAFAYCVCERVDVHVPKAAVLSMVLDHLKTPTPAASDEAFPPAAARRSRRKRDCRYTPKHGRGLNMAAIASAVWARQDLTQRRPSPAIVQRTMTAWATQRHAAQATANWRFTIANARRKLKRWYPSQSLC